MSPIPLWGISDVAALLLVLSVVFVAFLIIGMAMPVLPLHVHHGLGLSTFVVGLIVGSQFGVSLLSRFWGGRYADTRGPKRAVIAGLSMAVASGLLYLLSLRFLHVPAVSAGILLVGRALLGGAESLMITGAQAWGLVLGGPQNAGRAIAQVGMALWAAYAAGAPLGSALYAEYGFAAIALATGLLPLVTLLLVTTIPSSAAAPNAYPTMAHVLGAVWQPGLGSALGSVGFGTVSTFAALTFAERGWGSAWPAFTAMSGAFILARLLFAHLPDRLGGARVALACVGIEAAGQALIWLAPAPALVFVGAAATGFGWSLVYPGLGLEAVRRAPPESRGLAMGVYSAFLDLALLVANPALGLVASRAGMGSAFLASTLIVLSASGVILRLLREPAPIPGAADEAGPHPYAGKPQRTDGTPG